jgi:PAS domain S-box-containing protein
MKLIRSGSKITLSTAASQSGKNTNIKLERSNSDEEFIGAGESRFQRATSTMVALISPRPQLYSNDDPQDPQTVEANVRIKPISANNSPNKIDQLSTQATMIQPNQKDDTLSTSSKEIVSTQVLYESPQNGKPQSQVSSQDSQQQQHQQQQQNQSIPSSSSSLVESKHPDHANLTTTISTTTETDVVDHKHQKPKPVKTTNPTTSANTLSQLMERVTDGVIDDHYIQQHMKSIDFWMNQIFQFVENIPVGVSVGKFDKKLNTFPLCYVNREFEKMTKYSRQEILGKTCQFVQTEDRTEMCQVALIRKAIMNRQDCRVVLTNVKKDGRPFSNFLYLHPVFNRQKECTHYIGLQYDFTGNERIYRNDLVAIDDLMALLIALFWQ